MLVCVRIIVIFVIVSSKVMICMFFNCLLVSYIDRLIVKNICVCMMSEVSLGVILVLSVMNSVLNCFVLISML